MLNADNKKVALHIDRSCLPRPDVCYRLLTIFSIADARNSILSQILTPEAADRIGRIRLVKESRATDVENRLIMLARSGQLRQKVNEEQLKELLGAVAENQEREGGGGGGRIVVQRRKGDWDDDDDLLDM